MTIAELDARLGPIRGRYPALIDAPLRRSLRRARWLALQHLITTVSSAGVATVVATLVLSFATPSPSAARRAPGVLIAGLVALLAVARSRSIERALSTVIARVLDRWTDLRGRDYGTLLDLAGNHAVMEIAVQPDDWVAARTVGELRLRDEGCIVLGIMGSDGNTRESRIIASAAGDANAP